MIEIRDFPALNACLNAASACLLVAGYVLIRQGKRAAHKKAMLAACAMSVLFLCCYLIYHFNVGSVKFQKEGPIRTVYFAVLLTHTVLAATVPFLAVVVLKRAFGGQFAKHKNLARWALPIWLYVSVTGVIVYLMLYQL